MYQIQKHDLYSTGKIKNYLGRWLNFGRHIYIMSISESLTDIFFQPLRLSLFLFLPLRLRSPLLGIHGQQEPLVLMWECHVPQECGKGRANVISIITLSLDNLTSECFHYQGQIEFSGLLWQFLMFISTCQTPEALKQIVKIPELI